MLRRNSALDSATFGATMWLLATVAALMLSPVAALGALAFADTLQGGATFVFCWVTVPPALVAVVAFLLAYFE